MPLRDQAYTHPSLFRLSSLADPDRGRVHLRTWLSPAVGFPLHPLVGWQIPNLPVDVLDGDTVVWWTPTPDGVERLSLPIDLAAHEGPVFAELGNLPTAEVASWWCWVSVQVDDPGAPLTVAMVDRGNGDRALLARSSWPYTLGAGRITRLRLTGQAVITELRGVDASLFEAPESGPSTISPLPIPEGSWYQGASSAEDALTRAADVGPERTGPLDPPRDHPLTFDDEWARLNALVHIGRTGTKIGRSVDPDDLVFATVSGTGMDAHNVWRTFRRVVEAAGLDPTAWTPRKLRHGFVSLLSEAGVPLEQISRLVGHSRTRSPEAVYRKQLKPVVEERGSRPPSDAPAQTALAPTGRQPRRSAISRRAPANIRHPAGHRARRDSLVGLGAQRRASRAAVRM